MKSFLFVMALSLAAGVQAELKPGQIKTYEEADTDENGKLDLAEFTEIVKGRFEDQGKTGWEEAAAKQFKNKDKDKDGFLTLEEFWTRAGKKK